MTVPAAAAVSISMREAITSSYEDLRRSALAGGVHGGGTAGLTLFIRCGMARWMEMCIDVLERPAVTVPPRHTEQRHDLDPGLRGEVAMVLAQMALAAHLQGAMTC